MPNARVVYATGDRDGEVGLCRAAFMCRESGSSIDCQFVLMKPAIDGLRYTRLRKYKAATQGRLPGKLWLF